MLLAAAVYYVWINLILGIGKKKRKRKREPSFNFFNFEPTTDVGAVLGVCDARTPTVGPSPVISEWPI